VTKKLKISKTNRILQSI